MKKLIALVLALAMVATLGLAFASEAGHGSIVINNAVTGHTYTAYQIFAGDWDDSTAKLSNVTWGSGISDAGKSALETAYSATGAAAVAEKIPHNDAGARAFANNIGEENNLATGTSGTLSGTTYTISDLADGYYMIVDTYTTTEGNYDVLARYMIQKVGSATVNNKVDKPDVEKVIDADNNLSTTSDRTDENTADIGDTVTYVITSRVPDMTEYKEYYMDFSDTLSKGLTYDEGSLAVSIGGTTLDNTAYTLTVGEYSSTTGTSIVVHLKDLVSRAYAQNAAIVITYTAKVNDAAVIGNGGNPNTVKLTYSNNPRHSGDGTPDNEDDDNVTGETPDHTVKTYVTELQLLKVDGSNSAPLAGAVFNVTASVINKVIITGQRFVEDPAGTYYLLQDGTYTTKAPTEATTSQYLSTTVKYKKESYATTSVQETDDTAFQVVTGSDGIIKLTGLKEGTYTFTEIQAPDGFNLLASPITITITSNVDSSDTFAWAATGTNATVTDVGNGTFSFTVENLSGTTLPSTGGIGTTIFYILGGLLVVGAVVILVARRKAQD